jgi:hypothetical protein
VPKEAMQPGAAHKHAKYMRVKNVSGEKSAALVMTDVPIVYATEKFASIFRH